MDWRGAIRDLWAFLDQVSEMGFSLNPLELGQNISALWGLIQRAWEMATSPPPGDAAAIEAAAEDWRAVATALTSADDGFAAAEHELGGLWHGEAAEACATTLTALGDRSSASAAHVRRGVTALRNYADAITTAQRRHEDLGNGLRAAGDRLGFVAPWDIAEMITDVLRLVIQAVGAAIEAYTIAGEATEECERELNRAVSDLEFPPSGAPGMSALETMRVEHSDDGRSRPPLHGDVSERATDAYNDLSSAEQARVDDLLDTAPSEEHRAWILGALASGADVGDLENFAGHIFGLDHYPAADGGPSELELALDPGAHQLAQRSNTTCGSASLTYATMLNDPVYALNILDGYDAGTGTQDGGSIEDRFGAAEEEVMSRTNDSEDQDGNFSMPWPSALGTPPWGAAEEMNRDAGVGDGYGVNLVDSDSPHDRQQAYDDLAQSVDDGRVSPLYVGDDAIPRHVVLVVDRVGDDLIVYDPARGEEWTVSEADFVNGDLPGWDRPWATVTP